jgi:hypothetical protein
MYPQSKEIKSSDQALREAKKLNSHWSRESELTQRILIYCASLFEILISQGPKNRKRRRSAWQEFLSVEMKRGLTVTEAARKWQARKAKKAS